MTDRSQNFNVMVCNKSKSISRMHPPEVITKQMLKATLPKSNNVKKARGGGRETIIRV